MTYIPFFIGVLLSIGAMYTAKRHNDLARSGQDAVVNTKLCEKNIEFSFACFAIGMVVTTILNMAPNDLETIRWFLAPRVVVQHE